MWVVRIGDTSGGELAGTVVRPDPWARRVVLLHQPGQRELCAELRQYFARRAMQVAVVEPHGQWRPAGLDLPVVVVPPNRRRPHEVEACWQLVSRCSEAGLPAVTLLAGMLWLPADARSEVAGVVRYDRPDAPPSKVFAELVEHLLGERPTWLGITVDASQLNAPSGVSWWQEDLYVCDEHQGQVIKVTAGGIGTKVFGLDQPHHVHLDRDKILIANRGGHEVLLGELRGDAVAITGSLRVLDGQPLQHPNGVAQGQGLTVVADTDGHRVLVGGADPIDRGPGVRFRPLRPDKPFGYPTGVCIDERYLWVADTHHHRVLAFDHSGEHRLTIGGEGSAAGRFAYPTGLARYGGLLLVADEGNGRVQAFRLGHRGGNPRAGVIPGFDRLLERWIGKPFALSVNAFGHLAVSDRRHGCVWRIDIKQIAGIQPGARR